MIHHKIKFLGTSMYFFFSITWPFCHPTLPPPPLSNCFNRAGSKIPFPDSIGAKPPLLRAAAPLLIVKMSLFGRPCDQWLYMEVDTKHTLLEATLTSFARNEPTPNSVFVQNKTLVIHLYRLLHTPPKIQQITAR